jgi:phosphoglycerate dehydrogenase-like enzyme
MKLLIGHKLSDEEMARVRSAAQDANICLAQDEAQALASIRDAEIYVPGPWNEGVFSAAKRLRWVHFSWAGMNSTLFPAVVESAVTITNSAGVFSVPIAEHTMALMLSFARMIHLFARWPKEIWKNRETRGKLHGQISELYGATLGIVGYGGIGQETARRAKAFGMQVVGLRNHPEQGGEFADVILGPQQLDELLRQSDYLLISAPLNEATRGLIGERELALMKPEAVIINVARGAIIDEAALIQALRDGKLRGAGLDVTTVEPLPQDSPLWEMENVIITNHVGGASPQTWERQLALFLDNLERYLAGRPLQNVVDKKAGY